MRIAGAAEYRAAKRLFIPLRKVKATAWRRRYAPVLMTASARVKSAATPFPGLLHAIPGVLFAVVPRAVLQPIFSPVLQGNPCRHNRNSLNRGPFQHPR